MTLLANRVLETSTSTGQGDMTLLGNMAGYQSFASGKGVGSDCYYVIEAVELDDDGAPVATGEYETGRGTIVDSATLQRNRVINSSAGGAKVFFGPGLKRVYIDAPDEAIDTHTHIQNNASATWVVTHNLGKYPSVTVVDSGGRHGIASVVYNSADQLTITFGSSTSGKAYLN